MLGGESIVLQRPDSQHKVRRIAHGDKYAIIGFDNTFNIMQQQRISYFLESFT